MDGNNEVCQIFGEFKLKCPEDAHCPPSDPNDDPIVIDPPIDNPSGCCVYVVGPYTGQCITTDAISCGALGGLFTEGKICDYETNECVDPPLCTPNYLTGECDDTGCWEQLEGVCIKRELYGPFFECDCYHLGSGFDNNSNPKNEPKQIHESFDAHSDIIPDHLSLRLAPNPADEAITLLFEIPQSNELEVSIYNLSGQQIYQFETYVLKGKYQHRIRLNEDVSPGIYIVKAKVGEEELIQKLIKK